MGKGRYSYEPPNSSTACKARGSYLRVSYKNTRETADMIRGMRLKKAQKYLKDVIEHKDAVAYRRHTGNIGKHAQGHKYKRISSGGQARWPEKSCRFLLDLLQNAESNAETQGLDVDQMVLKHVQVNRAPAMRRRTYRAHGRIGPYMSQPCHIELVLVQSQKKVPVDPRAPKSKNKASGRLASGQTAADV